MIFLFQRKRFVALSEDVSDDVAWSEWESRGLAQPYWETSLVFLTREEGEAYGRSRGYNFPNGWRVYGQCAEGLLAELLKRT